ncbi:MAG: AHH domain-containing protein [Deltaproteobacteria bacterium]|nr:AHH domain-containing protein [Deltaproteobacteria bacterium]
MSKEQHQIDEDEDLEHFESRSAQGTGGKCLNRHLGGTPEEKEKKSCSHRWQAYLKMTTDKKLYNWPAYKSLSESQTTIKTGAVMSKGMKYPYWLSWRMDPPKKKEWDIKGDNFWTKCYTPYWHEAHHIVPNGVLRAAINDVGSQFVTTIRRGLLKEKYNLNYKNNMIMLPMSVWVAKALKLPTHRKSAFCRNHWAYSKHIKSELGKIFQKLKQKLVKHKKRKYSTVKRQIEAISKAMYKQIVMSDSLSLDKMEESEFKFR